MAAELIVLGLSRTPHNMRRVEVEAINGTRGNWQGWCNTLTLDHKTWEEVKDYTQGGLNTSPAWGIHQMFWSKRSSVEGTPTLGEFSLIFFVNVGCTNPFFLTLSLLFIFRKSIMFLIHVLLFGNIWNRENSSQRLEDKLVFARVLWLSKAQWGISRWEICLQ